MRKAVGVKFKPTGKTYDFDSGAFVLKAGDHVIVETEQGLGFGVVAVPPTVHEGKQGAKPLKKVFRLANEADFRKRSKNLLNGKKAHAYCLQCIGELDLKMNLFSVESAFDANKLTFFFTSEGRVDFRELVKRLVKKLGVRIEMRQVGIRTQARMCGGAGRCGREICCASHMTKSVPVSIRMAKEQNVALNPSKISGQCGRLMCCLTFENEMYRKLNEALPKMGKTINTTKGKGKVVRQNPLAGRLWLRQKDGSEIEVELEHILPDST